MSPKLIVIEGLDGSGTTTQARMLAEALSKRGDKALYTYEPSDGPIGTMIRQMLALRIVIPQPGRTPRAITRETLALLFAADRLDHVASKVEPALEAGLHVVSDRYYHSSIAYQGDIDDSGGDDFSWVVALNARARAPDITFVLIADAELCLDRMAQRGESRDLYETREKLERLAYRYDEVIEMLRDQGQHIVEIDAGLPIEDIHAAILRHLPPA